MEMGISTLSSDLYGRELAETGILVGFIVDFLRYDAEKGNLLRTLCRLLNYI